MEDPLQKANHRITELRAQLTTKLQTIKEKEQSINQLEKSVHDKDRMIAQLQSRHADEMTELQASIATRESDLINQSNNISASQTALDNARIAFDQLKAKQAKEVAEMRDSVTAMENLVEQVKHENDRLRLEIASQQSVYQTKLLNAANAHSAAQSTASSQMFELQSLITSQQQTLGSYEDCISGHLLSIKQHESTIMQLREQQDALIKQQTVRIDELSSKHSEQVRELTNQYLALTNESARVINDLRIEAEQSHEHVESLEHWATLRESIEADNRSLKNAQIKLKKDLDTQVKITQKLEKDFGREIGLLNDQISTLTQDRDNLQRELNTKKAALKVYKDEFESKAKQRIADEEKQRLATIEAKKQGQPNSIASAFGSLFSSKKEVLTVPSTPSRVSSQHPAHSSTTDKGFLDLEEEMAVALTERVEKLSVEKSRIEDELTIAQRTLEQERILSASLRAQLGDRAIGEKDKTLAKKDKVTLSPENTTKVLAETIARNRELEEFKREADKEMKRMKAQLDVRKQEITELRRTAKSGLNTTQQGKLNKTGANNISQSTRAPSMSTSAASPSSVNSTNAL